MLTPANTVDGFDPEFWRQGMATFAQYVSPWVTMVEDAKYQATIDRVQALGVRGIAGCHTPWIPQSHVATAFEYMRTAHTTPVDPEPGQPVLEEILNGLLVPA